MATRARTTRATSSSVDATLREVVAALAPLERRAGSPAEQEAARRLAERLQAAGAAAEVEEAEFHGDYVGVLLPLGFAGLAAGIAALSGRARLRAVAVSLLATAALVDDVSNGRRLWRRRTGRPRPTWNVVAQAGDEGGALTLVLMAHHDAAPTGMVFDPGFQRWLARRFPEVLARTDTSLPLWWPVVGGPALVSLGALARRRGPVLAGTALCAAICALAADVARSPIVPGANDNLSAVAALVAVAERLRAHAPEGLRVLLVSCGAEEVIQGGIYGFAARHFPRLDPQRTWFMNLDSIGSPELLMLEGEGAFRMEDYRDPRFRELIARAAHRAGRPLRRGVRARVSTDAVVPHRAGYPTVTLGSWEPETKLISNYHLMSDTPENLDYDTVAAAVDIVLVVIDELAGRARGPSGAAPEG